MKNETRLPRIARAGLLASLLLATAGMAAQPTSPPTAPPPAPAADEGATPAVLPLTELPMSTVDSNRMTVEVVIGESQPLDFIIDTGAERSGLAADIANRFGIRSNGEQMIVGFASHRSVPTVHVPRLRYARSDRRDVQALLFSRSLIGADGFLGIDSLDDQRIEFDFVRERLSLRRSDKKRLRGSPNSLVVKVVENQGRLIFSDAEVDRIRTNVILDTGSSLTIGNDVLRDQLRARGKIDHTIPVFVRTMTGEIIPAEYAIVREVTIGDAPIQRLPIAFATIEPFTQLGINDRPALLLGMDALRVFAAVTVDFPQRSVRFVSRKKQAVNTATRIREDGF